jgi:MFS family permease
MLGLMRLATSGTYGPMAAILSEMFPPQVRYTGISLAYQGAGAIFGGLSPLVATALVAGAGGAAWPAVALLVGMCALSVVCLAVAPRHRDPVPTTV